MLYHISFRSKYTCNTRKEIVLYDFNKKFSLIEYLENFKSQKSHAGNIKKNNTTEDIILKSKHIDLNPFEVLNRQGEKNRTYTEKFEIDMISLAKESEYYDDYMIFELNYQPITEITFKDYIKKPKYYGYYLYATNIIPIIYATKKAKNELFEKKRSFKVKVDFKTCKDTNNTYNFDYSNKEETAYKLTQDSLNFLEILTTCIFFDTVDLDNFKQNRFSKKRIKVELLSMFRSFINESLNFNETIPYEIFSTEMITTFWDDIDTLLTKYVYLIDEILISLCFYIPFINYSKEHGSKYTNISKKLKDLGEDEQKELIDEQLDNYTQNFSMNADIIGEDNIKEDELKKFQEVIKISKEVNKEFIHHGARLCITSKSLQLIRDFSNKIYTEVPEIEKNESIYGIDRYNLYTFNTANDENTSNFKYSDVFLKKLINVPITIDKKLLNLVSDFLRLKYGKRTEICMITKYNSIYSILTKYFIDNNVDSISIYLPFVLDFRGRVYSLSPLSITDVKIIRYILRPNKNAKLKVKKNDFYYDYVEHIDKVYKIDPKWHDIVNTLEEEEKAILLVGFVQLSKLVKSHLLTKSSTGCSVTLSEFILEGIIIFNLSDVIKIAEKYNIDDIDDIAYLKSTLYKVENYLLTGESFTIIIDSTASGIQHLSTWLLLKEEYKKYVNLRPGQTWYCTYTKLYQLLIENIVTKISEELLPLFTRKRLKKIFMTIPYNATPNRLCNYFCELMSMEDRVKIRENWKLILNGCYSIFNNIFEYKYSELHTLKRLKTVKKGLKIKNKDSIFVFSIFDSVFDFTYYKTTIVKKEIKFKGRRPYRWTQCKTAIADRNALIEKELKSLKKRIETRVIKLNLKIETETNEKKKEKNMITRDGLVITLGNKGLLLDKLSEKGKINIFYNQIKTLRALPANVMHCTDATYLKELFLTSYDYGIYTQTIHDEFIIPVENYFEFLEHANHVFERLIKEVHGKDEKLNALFILL